MFNIKEELVKDLIKRRAIDELGIDPSVPNSIELLQVEVENSVKRKKRLTRLEKEHLVDMVFNLESRNEFLLHNLSEVEKMYNKLNESKPVGKWRTDKVAFMKTCSECGKSVDQSHDYNYCPNCGIKMFTKEEKENE